MWRYFQALRHGTKQREVSADDPVCPCLRATIRSDAISDAIHIVLIDKDDVFVFGLSKLDVMFGRTVPADVRHPYRDIVKPGVRFLESTVRTGPAPPYSEKRISRAIKLSVIGRLPFLLAPRNPFFRS